MTQKGKPIAVTIAWGIFAVIGAMSFFSLFMYFFGSGNAAKDFFTLASNLLWGLIPVEIAFLAALIIARQPHNLIGWLLLGPAFALANNGAMDAHFEKLSSTPTSPSAFFLLALWFYTWSWLALIFPVFLILILFPTGRPSSPRARWIPSYVVGVGALFFIVIAFSETLTPQVRDWSVANPIGFISVAWFDQFGDAFFLFGLLSVTFLSLAAILVRFRHAGAVECEQIKWPLYASVLFAAIYGGSIYMSGLDQGYLNAFIPLALMMTPAAIGIAILRYRLWEIDLLIRRTLVYAILSVTLGMIYFGTVTILKSIFTALSGQSSAIALVFSTLAIAALFNPLRKRTQEFIDRRFYRQKYNAEQTLGEFSAAARNETDLAQLSAHLTDTIQESLQPAEVSLWLKTGKSKEYTS